MRCIKNTACAILLVMFSSSTYAQNITDSYRIENIALPDNAPPEVGAIQFDREGTLYVALRRNEILMAKPTADPQKFDWKVFATGFHNACGMEVIAPKHILISQMPELTEVKDTDDDGVADSYMCLTSIWGVSGNYHETNEICPDGEGGYYIAVGTASFNGPTFYHTRGEYSKIGRRGRNFSGVQWKGWVMHYAKDGTVTPFAKGFRMHNGIMRDSNGDLWCGDNQGDWRATTPLYHVKKGGFYGHPSSLVWDEDWPEGKDPLKMSLKEINALRTRAAVLLPHKEMNRSASEPVEIPKNFGPFAGQILLPDNNSNRISRIMLDKVDGEYQGSCTHFINGHGLRSGNNRAVFTADGKTLYIGQTVRGWGKPSEGLQRITWLGKTPFDVQQIQLTKKGFNIRFTMNADRSDAEISLRSFRYEDNWRYGGPQLDKRAEKSSIEKVEGNGMELDVQKLEPGRVYHIRMKGMKSKEGAPLVNQDFYYTLNRLVRD